MTIHFDKDGKEIKLPLFIDWYWIQGVDLGFDWDWEDGWITLNFLIFRIVICYK